MSNRLVILLLTFTIAISSSAQKVKDWEEIGDQAWEDKDWYSANLYYQKAFELDSADFDMTVKYVESLRMIKDYTKAEYYYEKLYNKDRGKVFARGQYWLASMQKFNGKYKLALRNYKKFGKKYKRDKDSYDWLKSQREIESCTWAINALRDDSETEITNIGAPVNTTESEFAPWIEEDSSFYYSSLKLGQNIPASEALVGVYSSQLSDSLFEKPLFLKKDIIDKTKHQANVSFNDNRSRVYFSRCSAENICKIMQADVDGNDWTNVEEVKIVNSSGYTSTMPHVATIRGAEVLLYTSNRPGSIGGLDIWWSEKRGGDFTAPVNAGHNINSLDNEISPFYLDGHLYFSSEWHNGFGGLDIFKSKGYPRSFDLPENLGYPINSSVNDLYYTYFPEHDAGYFVSNRPGSMTNAGETCCNDIYKLSYTDSIHQDTSIYQSLEDLNKYLPVTLYFHNDEPVPNSRDTTTTLSYMDAYHSYKKLESKYLKENERGLSGDEKENARFDVEEFYEFYVDKGVSDLSMFSKLLLVELEKGMQVELQIRGFASPRAESDYNVNLTKRRISSLVNYMSRYQDGLFLPFINGDSLVLGRLTFIEIPFGEYKADQEVSDALIDEKESIYSRGARLERKIEIESVQRALPDSSYAAIDFSENIHDFGSLKANEKAEHIYKFTNTGTEVLTIDSVETECGCTVPSISKTVLLPGESAELQIVFDTKGKSGKITKTVSLFTNASTEPKVLSFTAEVE